MFSDVKFLFDNKISYLVYWVTQNCNATCAFCFNYEENTKKNNDLTLDEIEKVARSLTDLKYLTIGGGEPSLRKDLSDVVGKFAEYSRLRFCNIVMNGFRWRQILEHVERICIAHPQMTLHVGLSIDFIGANHNKHRRLEGCYDGCIRVIEGVKAMRSRFHNLHVGVGGTVTADNVDSIVATGRHIMETYHVPYSITLIRGTVEDMSLKAVDARRYREIASELLSIESRVLPRAGFAAAARFALEEASIDVIHRSIVTGAEQVPCQAGRKALVLEAAGRLRLCETLDDDFGNVRDHGYDLPAMIGTESARATVAQMRANKCHCTWECFNRANVAFDPRQWPRVAALAARKLVTATA